MNKNFYSIFFRSLISFTFPGVLVIVYKRIENSYEFLLIKSKHSNAVTFPSGVLNWGENYTQAAKREVEEETGIILNNLIQIPLTHEFSYYSLPLKPRSIQQVFVSEYVKNSRKPPIDQDIEWIKWTPENNVQDLITYPELRDTFSKILVCLNNK